MRVWVSKYALTHTVYEDNVTHAEDRRYVRGASWRAWYRLGRDAHESREAAVKDAERRRTAKIDALKKQIAKLEALKFDEVEDG